jgi:hypothetical protein
LISRQSADRKGYVGSGADSDVVEGSNELTSWEVFHVGFIIRLESSSTIWESTLNHILLNQSCYITKLIEKYQLEHSRSVNDKAYVENFPTRELIGALNYIAVCSRPDISFAVSTLARYQDFPNLTTCEAIKHLLKYLNTTKDLSLIFSGKVNGVVGFCDSEWTSDRLTHQLVQSTSANSN